MRFITSLIFLMSMVAALSTDFYTWFQNPFILLVQSLTIWGFGLAGIYHCIIGVYEASTYKE